MANLKPFLESEITDKLIVGDEILVEASNTYLTYVIAVSKKWAFIGRKEDIGRKLTSFEKITWSKLHIGRAGNSCMQDNFAYMVYTFQGHKK